ncbi:MAG: PKD domain-containing protein, partial [Bacteroidia bacterium]
FAQNMNVYRTDNLYSGIPYWFPISTFNQQARAMASNPANANLLYVVTTANQLWRSDDATNQFNTPTFVNYPTPIGVGSWASIAPIANNTNVVYVSCGSKVYRSDDKGVTWANVTYNLPNVNIIRVIHDVYSTDESIYVGTAKGVYYKNNSMSSWLNYSNGLPTIADITDFMIYNNGTSASVLRVSYYGRGVWESSLNTSLAPVAAFSSSQNILCAGTAVQFTDLSSGTPFSWQWNFPGGTPSSSTLQNPVISYSTPGTYSVTLTVTNTSGSNTIVQNPFINVTAAQALPLAEGFQGAVFVPSNWQNVDVGNDNVVWAKDNTTGGFGLSSSCTSFNNFDYDVSGFYDELRTPKYNFTNLASTQLTFDVAYARYDASYTDTLAILVSTDCGITFTQEYTKGGTMLATAPDNTNYFVPSSTQWRTDTVDLSAYIGQSNVMVSFQNRGHYGNVLYLDNINLNATSTSAPVAGFYASSVSVCEGNSVSFTDLTSGIPSAWNWIFPGGSPPNSSLQNPVITYNTAGTFDVTLVVSNANGNDSITLLNYITVNSPPTAPVISQNLNVLSSTPGNTYQWYLNGSLIAGATNQNYNATINGNYTVVITDANGCTASSFPYPFVFNPVNENSVVANSLSVYPNPANDFINISFNAGNKNQDFILEIKNLLGQTVYHENLISQSGILTKQIDVSKLSRGMYLILVTGGNQAAGKKILID